MASDFLSLRGGPSAGAGQFLRRSGYAGTRHGYVAWREGNEEKGRGAGLGRSMGAASAAAAPAVSTAVVRPCALRNLGGLRGHAIVCGVGAVLSRVNRSPSCAVRLTACPMSCDLGGEAGW
eukprot:5368244-Prymnesium_polylepis.1